MANNDQRKSIVILGAGFGGLHCARLIAKKIKREGLVKKYRVLLVDQNDYHTYTPTLYEAATTSEETANQLELKKIITFPVRENIRRLPIDFVKTKITKIDIVKKDIRTETGTAISFDYLVLALGSVPNYFNIPGLAEHALPLKTFLDSLHIRERLLMEAADKNGRRLEIVIGGGGSAGVEIAGEVQLWLSHYEHKDTRVTIVEGGPTVLCSFDEPIVKRAQKRLAKLGVVSITNERIASVTDKAIQFSSGGELQYDLLIWTGGIKPNPLITALPFKKDESSTHLMTDDGMKLGVGVYGLGDAVCFINPKTGKPIPGVARAAISQANVIGHNILEEIKVAERKSEKTQLKNYHPINYPYIIPIGGKYAIAKVGPIIISGFFGWLLKAGVEINYLVSILPFYKAIKTWLKGLWIFIQNDRLG